VHDSRGIEIVNFTILLALSTGTLMASAGTPYRLVPAAHFYPCSGVGPTFYIVVNSAGLRSMLLMLQVYANSRNRPTATDEKSLLYFGCDFSGGWYNFGKIIKIVSNRCHILKLNAPNSVSSGAPPPTPVRKRLLYALPTWGVFASAADIGRIAFPITLSESTATI